MYTKNTFKIIECVEMSVQETLGVLILSMTMSMTCSSGQTPVILDIGKEMICSSGQTPVILDIGKEYDLFIRPDTCNLR